MGAPASTYNNVEEGAAFMYAWNENVGAGGEYELTGIARPTAVSYGTVPAEVKTAVIYPNTSWNLEHNSHFGASVGYVFHQNPYFYVVSYNRDRTETAISALGGMYYNARRSKVVTGEYGAFFTLPAEYTLNSAPHIGTILGFLVRDSGLKIKYGVVNWQQGGVNFQSPDISIDTGTDVDAGFTTLYTTPNKLSFAALTNQLFIAQGTGVKRISLTASTMESGGTISNVRFDKGADLVEMELSSGGQTEAFRFTEITAISILRFANDKFYLAVGEATVNGHRGKVVVFEGTNEAFLGVTQRFTQVGDKAGDMFGWSVKLQLLDSDGAGSDSPEPVLFVGAPKASSADGATSGVGYVKVFGLDGADIQTITPPAYCNLTYVRAFGYSLGGGFHATTNNYLFVGAPASEYTSTDDSGGGGGNGLNGLGGLGGLGGGGSGGTVTQEGAAFVYKWNGGGGSYALKAIARPTEDSHGSVGSVLTGHPSGSAWDTDYSNHFGASVGYANFGSEPHLYVVSYKSDHSGTAITVFGIDNADALLYRDNLTSVHREAYGAFFTLSLGQVNPVEGLGFLVREENGDLKIKYGVMQGDISTGRINYQSISDTLIETGTSVLAEFTTLYVTTNKLSFTPLADKLFVAQGENVYSTSFALNPSSTTQLTTAAKGFTKITSISVLKFANQFYLAVGDPTDSDSNERGRVVVYEAADSEFSDIEQTFEVLGDKAGDWFGWSVRLQLLDRDGLTGDNPAEPVLFVGAPKASSADGATSGVGYVQVFDISGSAIQNPITPPAFSTSYVGAFGYSLSGGFHTGSNRSPVSESYLFVGAPKSTHTALVGGAAVGGGVVVTQEGAAFVYKWNGLNYELEGVARPTENSHGSVGSV